MSVEVTVTKDVPDSVWTKALNGLFEDLVRAGAEAAQNYAPTDMGKLKQSLNPQQADVVVESGAWPTWATYGPKGDPATYGGYLNAGSYVRTWVPPIDALTRWVTLKKFASGKGARRMAHAIQKRMALNLGATVRYHYIANPNASPIGASHDDRGTQTKGWFTPSVPKALEAGPIDKALDDFAREIEGAWR